MCWCFEMNSWLCLSGLFPRLFGYNRLHGFGSKDDSSSSSDNLAADAETKGAEVEAAVTDASLARET